MTNKYGYGYHWLNVESGDKVYSYSHGKIYVLTILHTTSYYRTIEHSKERKETYLDYVIFEAIGKSNRKTKFRYDVGTCELELGYGRDYNGNLRFSCLNAIEEYIEYKKRYHKNNKTVNKIIEQINNLHI